MSTLEEKLALSKRMTQIEQFAPRQEIVENTPHYTFTKPGSEPKPYNPKEELKRLQEGFPKDLSHCKLPQSIIESIIKNPLTDISSDLQMDSFTTTLGESLGIKQSANIIEKLENIKPTQTVKQQQQQQQTQPIDYEMIKMIVENAVDKKIQTLQEKGLLVENKTNNINNQIKTIHFGTDSFLFLDSDDNVYECVMKYKGKRKRK